MEQEQLQLMQIGPAHWKLFIQNAHQEVFG